jgi:predicted HTH transcriptional regulator
VAKPIPSYQVYRGDVFQLITQAVDFVMSRIDARVGTRDTDVRVDVDYELPLAAVTEAIVNAIAHRDYSSNGSVQVMLFKNRLEIWNPGRLPVGLTVEKLRHPHTSIPVNPLLANPMYLAGSIERMGTGTGDIITKCEAAGLRTPIFTQEEDFKVTLWRPEDETEQPTEQPDPKVVKLIQILDTPKKMSEIMAELGLKHRPHLLYEYLRPAILGGLVVPSHPDNPNHPEQTYSLTEKGRKFLK